MSKRRQKRPGHDSTGCVRDIVVSLDRSSGSVGGWQRPMSPGKRRSLDEEQGSKEREESMLTGHNGACLESSTQEEEAGGLLQVRGQNSLYRKFLVSQGYKVWPCVKKVKKKKKRTKTQWRSPLKSLEDLSDRNLRSGNREAAGSDATYAKLQNLGCYSASTFAVGIWPHCGKLQACSTWTTWFLGKISYFTKYHPFVTTRLNPTISRKSSKLLSY